MSVVWPRRTLVREPLPLPASRPSRHDAAAVAHRKLTPCTTPVLSQRGTIATGFESAGASSYCLCALTHQ